MTLYWDQEWQSFIVTWWTPRVVRRRWVWHRGVATTSIPWEMDGRMVERTLNYLGMGKRETGRAIRKFRRLNSKIRLVPLNQHTERKDGQENTRTASL